MILSHEVEKENNRGFFVPVRVPVVIFYRKDPLNYVVFVVKGYYNLNNFEVNM